MREMQHERRGAETEEQREDRLQQMGEMQHERRGAETEEQREDRLQQMREMQHERRGAETEEQREDRLQQMRLHSTAAQSVHLAFPNAPPRLNAYLWLPTLLSRLRLAPQMSCISLVIIR